MASEAEAGMHVLKRFLRWLTGLDRFDFDNVVLTGAALSQVVGFAKRTHPREFSALLGGKVRNKTLLITHIVYQHFVSTEREAMIALDVPIGDDIMGTVHSHPTPNNLPSAADRRYFSKGWVNAIICHPYRPQDIAFYDGKGRGIVVRKSADR